MAVTHPSSMRNLIADQVTAQCDVGTTKAQLLFKDSGSTTVCILTFSSSAFDVAAAGVAVANTIADGNSTIAGTVTIGLIRSATEFNTVLSCSITSTGGGGDIELSSNVISSGQTISMTALQYAAPN